jgi:hypothetical protein
MLISPLLSVALLAGVMTQASRHVKPQDVEPFHQRAKQAIMSYPYIVGTWAGQDEVVPDAAVKLLRPNAILSRSYRNSSLRGGAANLQLLIDQCKDSRDMLGHYPPVCYPANGSILISKTPRDWKVGDLTIPGMEYEFSDRVGDQTYQRIVYNFLIIPGRGIARSMDAVSSAAEDYQERYYGAAQFQMVISAAVPRAERDRVFAMMVGVRPDIIKTLMSGGIRENAGVIHEK